MVFFCHVTVVMMTMMIYWLCDTSFSFVGVWNVLKMFLKCHWPLPIRKTYPFRVDDKKKRMRIFFIIELKINTFNEL